LLDRTTGDVMDTPEEYDVFRALGLPWIEPSDRRADLNLVARKLLAVCGSQSRARPPVAVKSRAI
jgi:hypothetical protein